MVLRSIGDSDLALDSGYALASASSQTVRVSVATSRWQEPALNNIDIGTELGPGALPKTVHLYAKAIDSSVCTMHGHVSCGMYK